ncbi:MAG: DUF2812 domain-containing protein [Erysipelotrichaceae bacterium]|nr:DUF2812 domain-containing protein [Erysipelotrichaceae bacterium]
MNLSRDYLTSVKSPWTPERKMKEWLEDQAANGWFLDSFKFKFMNCSVQFTFRRCEPIECEFFYSTMVPQLFDKEAYEKDLEEGWYVVAFAENYLALSNGKPTYVSEDIK